MTHSYDTTFRTLYAVPKLSDEQRAALDLIRLRMRILSRTARWMVGV